jgi:hypothetical protein
MQNRTQRVLSSIFAFLLSFSSGFLTGYAQANQVDASKSWENIHEEEGIRAFRKSIPGSPVLAFRGDAVLNASISKIASVLIDSSRKTEWVANCEAARTVQEISEYERIEYNHTGTPVVIKDRDFVFHAKAYLDRKKKRMVIRVRSTPDDRVPPTQYVRGEILDSHYILTMVGDGSKTHVQVQIQVDPKGSVPKWLANLTQKSWPTKTLKGIQRQAAKPDVKEHEGVKKYFSDPKSPDYLPEPTPEPYSRLGSTIDPYLDI